MPPEPAEAPAWRVPLTDVRLPAEARKAADEVLRSGWLSSGPRVARFERDVAAYVGTEHAVACSSGTAALQLALAALRVGPRDEVLMPSLTFVAAANVVRLLGARPVFADIVGEDDLTLDPHATTAALGPRTRAIVPMHYGGWPCHPALVELASERGIPLVEDAAHALGAGVGDRRCGSWGTAGCFSFFANKNLPLGEGGMLTTDDSALAGDVRLLRSHGMTTGTWQRHTRSSDGYDVLTPGFNARFDELRAAIGSVLLAGLNGSNAARASACRHYRNRLVALEGVRVPFLERPEHHVPGHHLFVVLLDGDRSRDKVAAGLAARGIQTSVHYRPVHLLSAYTEFARPLPRTDAVWPRLLTLPLFPHLSVDLIDFVCDALGEALSDE